GIDLRVAAFAAAMAALVALAAGTVPALTLTSANAGRSAGGRVTARHARLQSIVVALQACMSLVLMTGAGLLVRSVLNEQGVDPGFRAEKLLTFRVDVPSALDRSEERVRRYDEIERALRALSGVREVSAAMTVPLASRANTQAISLALDEK